MSYSNEEKAMWLEDWKQSGKGAWAYARENGLIPQTFVGWTKKGIKAKQDFVEIRPKARTLPQTRGILIEKGDIKIHLPIGIGSNDLCTILEGLRAAI
jgi:transposase-like protein